MPAKPGRWCAACRVVHGGTEKCPERKPWSTGATAKRSGRGGRPWRRKRQRVFERDNYLCREHMMRGKLVSVSLSGPAAGVCDHIVPIEEGGTDDENNLQTLCKSCSNTKTQQESLRGRGGYKS